MDNEMRKAVDDLIAGIEERYQELLRRAETPDNPLKRFIYLDSMIDALDEAPDFGLMRQSLLLRLYTLRSEVATDAEFIRIMYPGTREI